MQVESACLNQKHKQSTSRITGMTAENPITERIEISPRFRKTIEERIVRLEEGADHDEAQLKYLTSPDHIRRQTLLIAMQRAEALRMRLFLDRAGTRLPRPLIIL
jgi:hypothetical protein